MGESLQDDEICNETYTTVQKNSLLIIAGSNAFISFCVGTVAVTSVFCLKLHKIFTYRLAMYQVMSGMMFSFAVMLFFGSINYNKHKLGYKVVCQLQAFLSLYLVWVKLLFTLNLIIHLFCLVVFMKNFKKLELFYVLFSTLFPLSLAWIPFIHNNFNLAGAWCWIRDWKGNCASMHYMEGIVEQFVLWFGPLVVFLVIGIVIACVIFIVLVWRIYRLFSVDKALLEKSNLKLKHQEMLREVLPLLAYPIIFCLLSLIPIANRIYNAVSPSPSFELAVLHALTIYSMGMFSSIVLLVHVIVVKCCKRKTLLSKPHRKSSKDDNYGATMIKASIKSVPATSDTAFVIPTESEVDRLLAGNVQY